MLELEKGSGIKAIEDLKKAVSLLPFQFSLDGGLHALYYNSLAFAYYKTGDFTRAQENTEK